MPTSAPAKCSPTSSGSSRRRSCGGCRSASCSRTPGSTCAVSHCAATGCSSRSARGRRACASGPSSRTWNGTSRCGSCANRSPTTPTSRAGSRSTPRPWRRSSTRTSRRCTTTGGSPGGPTWSAATCGAGVSPTSRLAARRSTPRLAQRVVEQVASALAFAHRQGIVHGRVRPSNVLLDGDGNAYLGDFPVGLGGARRSGGRPPAPGRLRPAPAGRRGAGQPAATASRRSSEAAVRPDPKSLQGAATVRRGRRP